MSVTIAGFPIDAVTREEHGFEADVTSDPVEVGADTTDHVRDKNPTLVLSEAIVSDTPIGDIITQRPAGSLPSRDALDLLLRLRDEKEPFTIVTERRTYTDMLMVGLSIAEDARTGDALGFTARFQQIRFAENNRVIVQVATPRGKAKVNRGNKPSATVAKPPKLQSTLFGPLGLGKFTRPFAEGD